MKKALYFLLVFFAFLVLANLQHLLALIPAYNNLYSNFPFYVPETLRSLLQILVCLGLVMLLLKAGFRAGSIFLGIDSKILPAFAAALIISLPMALLYFIGSGITGQPAPALICLVLTGPFAEEVLFRGFAFGILYRELKIHWLAAAILVGIFFGLGHVSMGHSLKEVLPIFAITTAGSIFFSWLYKCWRTIWVPVFVHAFMNFYWILFSVSDNAFGGLYPTLLQFSTIISGIAITANRKRLGFGGRRKLPLEG